MSILKFINANKERSIEHNYLEYYKMNQPLCVCKNVQKFINSSKGYMGYCSVECKQKTEKYNTQHIMHRIRTEAELTFSSYEYRQINKYLQLSSADIYLIKYPDSNKCEVCGNNCTFVNSKVGFLKTCSYICGNSLPRTKLTQLEKKAANNKRRKTNLERYGVEHNFQLLDTSGKNNTAHKHETKKQRKETMLARYGVEHALQNASILKKQRNTTRLRFGDEFPLRTKKGMASYTSTMNELYGVSYPMQSPKLVTNFKLSRLNNYNIRTNQSGISGFVYITYFKDYDLYKIGLASDTIKRHNKLYRDFGHYKCYILYETNDCYGLERHLHKMFSYNRIPLLNGCGKTEFFKIDSNDINNISLYDLPDHISYKKVNF